MSYSLPFKEGDKIIELGGGTTPLQGVDAINVDVRPAPEVDIVRNLEEDFSDVGKFDGLFASYIAEHISWRKIQQFFKSCFNILNDGGVAVFIVPNTLAQMKKVIEKGFVTLEDSQFIFGDQNYSENSHKVAFSKPLIEHLLREAGFSDVRIVDHPDKQARDMIVEGYKHAEVAETHTPERREWILNQCNVGEKILDVGSANGWIFRNTPLEPYVTFMDIDRYSRSNFIQLDAHKLATYEESGIEDKSFDVAILGDILEHVDDPVKVLRGAKRVARRLIITVPDPENWIEEYRPYETLEEVSNRKGKTPYEMAKEDNPQVMTFHMEDGCSHIFHRRWYTEESLKNDLKLADIENFSIERLQYSGWSFFVVTQSLAQTTAKDEPIYEYLRGE